PPLPLFPPHGFPFPLEQGSLGGPLAPPFPALPPFPDPLSLLPFPGGGGGGGGGGAGGGAGGGGGGAGGGAGGGGGGGAGGGGGGGAGGGGGGGAGGGGGGGGGGGDPPEFPCEPPLPLLPLHGLPLAPPQGSPGGGLALPPLLPADPPLPLPFPPPLSADGGGGGGGLDLSAACSGAPEPVSAPAEPFVTPEPPALSAVERAPELSTMAPFSIRAESAGAGARPVTSRFSIARSRGNGPPEGSSALPSGRRDSPPPAPRTEPPGAEGSTSMSNSPRSTFSTDAPGRGKMGCRPVREAPLSSAGSGVMVSPESPLGSPLLPVRAA